jgi:hypothetical protein
MNYMSLVLSSILLSYFSVFVIFSDSDVLRDFLYAADELLMTEGDHVFITMELFPSDWLGYYTQFERGTVYGIAGSAQTFYNEIMFHTVVASSRICIQGEDIYYKKFIFCVLVWHLISNDGFKIFRL